MQSAPFRLQQAIWTAFKAAKPVPRLTVNRTVSSRTWLPTTTRPQKRLPVWTSFLSSQARFYSNDKKTDVDRKIEDAQQRIDEALQSRVDTARSDEELLKKDETIIHTYPEASSIVYNPDSPGESAVKATATSSDQDVSKPSSSSSTFVDKQLPSQISARYSQLQKQFSSFMDNLQGNIFIASKRLNDLTGYSGIEALKQEIENQELLVREARKLVRDQRTSYTAAIENRSATQREVNDLLHRKHAWSPTDLERFTNLYRSDHANEQAEQKAHEELSKAEQQYEEASTRLAKSILARYHEEQIWSDKIRQMSTWGTWGLMGLNVLLFIVFQIIVEPWRRRRLVRGFEEKVQQALRDKESLQEKDATIAALKAEKHAAASTQISEAAFAAGTTAGTRITSALTPVSTETSDSQPTLSPSAASIGDTLIPNTSLPETTTEKAKIEQAVETVITAQALQEENIIAQIDIPPAIDLQFPPDSTTKAQVEETIPIPSLAETPWILLPDLALAHAKIAYHLYSARLRLLFDETIPIKATRRDLTASALEGAFFGAISVACFFWVIGVGGVRGDG